MLRSREELILQAPRLTVLFNESDRACQCAGAGRQQLLSLLRRCHAAIASIMRGMIGIPPDAGINAHISKRLQSSERHSFAVCAQFILAHLRLA